MGSTFRDDLAELTRDTRAFLEQEKAKGRRIVSAAAPSPAVLETPAGVSKGAALSALYESNKACVRCDLGRTRIQFVFGVGNPEADVLFVGEGPGYEEDRRGEPFVGRAGQLLDKILEAIGLSRETVYIANIVKCHPMQDPQHPELRGNDRPPTALEVETCFPILRRQIEIIRPRVIVTLGSPSTRALLQTAEGISKIRGRFFPLPSWPAAGDLFGGPAAEPLPPVRVLPVYHPAALLRNPNLKRDMWEDMKKLRAALSE